LIEVEDAAVAVNEPGVVGGVVSAVDGLTVIVAVVSVIESTRIVTLWI
jgi:hypothetical protein